MLLWLLPIVAIIVVIFSIGLINYIRIVKNPSRGASTSAHFVKVGAVLQWLAFIVPAILLLIVMIVALVKPTLIFGFVHYGWVIGVFIAVPVITIIISLICYNHCGILFYEGKRLALVIVVNAMCLVLMVIRMATIPFSTIKISSIYDFTAIHNLPQAKCYRLTNDLDFKDTELIPIKYLPSNCVFDGNGHSISNAKITTICDVTEKLYGGYGYYFATGLFAVCEGEIINLTMNNVKIELNEQARHAPYKVGWNEMSYPDWLDVGIIAGANFGGNIKNCKVIDCSVDLSMCVDFHIPGKEYGVEGICGFNYSYKKGHIDDCEVEGYRYVDS